MFCVNHDPEHIDKQREASARGGRSPKDGTRRPFTLIELRRKLDVMFEQLLLEDPESPETDAADDDGAPRFDRNGICDRANAAARIAGFARAVDQQGLLERRFIEDRKRNALELRKLSAQVKQTEMKNAKQAAEMEAMKGRIDSVESAVQKAQTAMLAMQEVLGVSAAV